jgi:RecB family exonuclease
MTPDMKRSPQNSGPAPGRGVQPELPGLTLVLGPANAGKMGYALQWWRTRLPLQPVVVAPTGPDAEELTMEMVRRAGALVGQSPALTFDGLVQAILKRPPRHLTEFEGALLMSRLLSRTPLRSLDKVARLPGAATALATLLRQLGESGRTASEIEEILSRWVRSEPGAAGLADDIRRLNEAYAIARDEWGLTDGPAAVRDAAREALRDAGCWVRPVVLYGFTSFTPGQRALIEALSRKGQALVTLPYDRSRPVNLSTPSEVARWQALATETVELTAQIPAYSSPAIAHLERYFLSDPPLPEPPSAVSGPQGVRFLLASGQRNEAELAAQHIATLIREGFRPGDIAVIVRRIQAWSGLLAQVFELCGIPCRIDDRRTLAQTGLGNAFLSALRGVVFDDAEAVLAYLRGPYSGLELETASDLELSYRRGAARGARALAKVGGLWQVEGLEPLWAAIVAGEGGMRLDVAALESWVRCLVIAGLRGAVVGGREIEEDARAFRALGGALSTLKGLTSGGDTDEWLNPEMVLGALARITVPGSRSEANDAVQILSVERARARRFGAVVILGLVEGEFPGRLDTPSLLTGAQRARIDSVAGGGLWPPEMEQEGALFASAVSRAWQLLFLSARDADDGGGEAMPSHFWHLSKELLGVSASEHEGRTLADLVFDLGSAPSLRHYLRACAASGCAPHPEVPLGSAKASGWTRRPPYARLVDPAVLAELMATESFSPSSLEAYLACPFAWFVERVMGIEEVDSELDGRVFGQLLHSALGATYRELSCADALPLRVEGVAEAERVTFAIIDGLVDGEECPGTRAEKRLAGWRLKRLACNLFRMEAADDGLLVFSETESRVGGYEGVDIGGLRLRGRIDRIDRIDVAPRGPALFVLDYKSGAVLAASGIGTERGLQLPLYLMALTAERPDAEVIGGAYLSLSEAKRAGVVLAGAEGVLGSGAKGCRVLDGAAAEELFRQTREFALAAAAGMRAGLITPRPERECPPWCRLGPACRSGRGGHRA